ncbi:uncharacterized protein EHS24_001769 [Apiotrichum porosum]|uniref:Uncharacterized protein n=1 Tax=Apiotrichum porosum TaxID=105984 RepID=A0A427XJ49_9TREE|nr:uncharacterized protein EHS24_001769 [Apiotrichum porosum]RSH78848.1 hypothetical protein EHS24_001769 [Apiotrichum porosum]
MDPPPLLPPPLEPLFLASQPTTEAAVVCQADTLAPLPAPIAVSTSAPTSNELQEELARAEEEAESFLQDGKVCWGEIEAVCTATGQIPASLRLKMHDILDRRTRAVSIVKRLREKVETSSSLCTECTSPTSTASHSISDEPSTSESEPTSASADPPAMDTAPQPPMTIVRLSAAGGSPSRPQGRGGAFAGVPLDTPAVQHRLESVRQRLRDASEAKAFLEKVKREAGEKEAEEKETCEKETGDKETVKKEVNKNEAEENEAALLPTTKDSESVN